MKRSSSKRQPRESFSQKEMLYWLWQALKLNGRAPREVHEVQSEQWDALDAARPLPLSWARVSIGGYACEALVDIMLENQDSPLFDMMDAAQSGMLLVAPPGGGSRKLMLVFEETEHIDPFDFDPNNKPSVVHPGWRMSCEYLK